MPTDLGPAFPPSFQGIPPGVSPRDFAIWKRFREHIVSRALRLFFNVRVGEGRPLPPDTPEFEKRLWFQLTAKRIDVVVEFPDSVLLVELRANASSAAVGRLLLYRRLWMKADPIGKSVRLAVVTDNRDEELAEFAESSGVEYWVV